MQDNKAQHPSHQELVELFVEILPEHRAAEIRAHLSGCEDCNRQFLELHRLPDDAPKLGAEETAQAWQRLEAAIDAEPVERIAPVLPFERPPAAPAPAPLPRITGHPTWRLLAATLAGAAIGLLLGRSVLSQPEAIRLTDESTLIATKFTDRGEGEKNDFSCASERNFLWTLPLEFASAPPPKVFVEIQSKPSGKTIDLLEEDYDPQDDFKLTVPRSRLPAGKYRLLVRAERGGEPIEMFDISIICHE